MSDQSLSIHTIINDVLPRTDHGQHLALDLPLWQQQNFERYKQWAQEAWQNMEDKENDSKTDAVSTIGIVASSNDGHYRNPWDSWKDLLVTAANSDQTTSSQLMEKVTLDLKFYAIAICAQDDTKQWLDWFMCWAAFDLEPTNPKDTQRVEALQIVGLQIEACIDKDDGPSPTVEDASPLTTQVTQSKTVSISKTFSVDGGMFGDTPTGTIGYSKTWSRSTSTPLPDVRVENLLKDSVPCWRYWVTPNSVQSTSTLRVEVAWTWYAPKTQRRQAPDGKLPITITATPLLVWRHRPPPKYTFDDISLPGQPVRWKARVDYADPPREGDSDLGST